MAIFGAAASAGSKEFAHSLTFGITLAVMTNIAQVLYHKEGKHFAKYGPFYLSLVATVLVLLDPLRHVLQDAKIWTNSSMYRPGCEPATIKCLSVLGVFFTIIFTYSGYAMLLVSVLWGTDLHKKVAAAWRVIRARQRAKAQMALNA
eukprot:m51a1_g7538 hypothetical protein (147) ;mRNA; r:60466-61138